MIELKASTQINTVKISPDEFPLVEFDYSNRFKLASAFENRFPECTITDIDNNVEVFDYCWWVTYTRDVDL